ncbi:centrosomal protein CCDC61 isoform X2 [Dromaius novaehollandiae]|uniref:centrosomal protein CCDC61 isoform X2 n=1 Tax=Dromaius novaehollandiae TaxID=8790 RepID=UPI003120055F
MAAPQCVQADCAFRGGEHAVRLAVSGSALEVEVEDRLTGDQWRGQFDAAFIEDLTHKTGNFKQFGIFCSMLESALTQSSEAVSLDLLTYGDLEALRSRKLGGGPRPPPPATATASPLSSKRYLILIYSVEFDRIHYPLPLPYAGRPDPAALRRLIRELREELALLRARPGEDCRDAEIRRLRDELRRALEEKREAEAAARGLRREAQLAAEAGAAEETRTLRAAVRSLRDELLRERSRHQRAASKRLQENRQLAGELAEAKASERTLRLRLKSLTAELALYKKGRWTPPGPAPPRGAGPRSGSGSGSVERSAAWPPPRRRSASGESRAGSRGRPPPRSPSPAGPRPPRFDPTAFVRARERKQREAELKNQRQPRRGTRGVSDSPGRSRGRSSSAGSARSRRSAASSGSEADDCSEPLAPRRAARGRKPLSSSSWNGPSPAPRAPTGRRKQAASTPRRAGKENLREEPAGDLAEIDARLRALQEYMSSLDTRT